MRRVVVTGMAGLSPIGNDWSSVRKALLEKRSAVEVLPELGEYKGMDTRLAALVADFEVPAHYPRKRIRSMGRVALLATRATELALIDAGLEGDPVLSGGRTGISYGSTAGSPPAMEIFALRFHAGRDVANEPLLEIAGNQRGDVGAIQRDAAHDFSAATA